MASNCFRISLLPTPGSEPCVSSYQESSAKKPLKICIRPLDRRSCNLLHYFPCAQVAQLVLHRLFEHDRVSANLQHVAVEDRIVLTQKVSFVEAVDHDRDHATVGFDDSAQRDLIDGEAALPRTATLAPQVLHDGADEGIAAIARGDITRFLLPFRGFAFGFCRGLRR